MKNLGQRVVAIIQARMDSSRLPGKVLACIGSKPALAWSVERVSRASLVDKVVIATTRLKSDDAIEAFASDSEVGVFRGSTHDVLDRFYSAAKLHEADLVVRVTGDCPFVDPELVDEIIRAHCAGSRLPDLSANRLPGRRGVPIGLDLEVVTFEALGRAHRAASEPRHREHVLPFIYENPSLFVTQFVSQVTGLEHCRWTLDTPDDLAFLREVALRLSGMEFSWREVADILRESPGLQEINAHVAHKSEKDVDARYGE